MSTQPLPAQAAPQDRLADDRVFLFDVSWEQYEALLEMRGESSGVRIAYLKGEVEILSPSVHHERLKTRLARLVEAWAEESGVELVGCGSWTLKRKRKERGAEPDECYAIDEEYPERPDLAIEVVWTSGGLDKLAIYRELGVQEVWMWRKGALHVHGLRGGGYLVLERSELLPDLDLDLLASFLEGGKQTEAVRAYRRTLRERG